MAGLVRVTFSVLSAAGKTLLSKSTTLSVPEFAFVQENVPTLKQTLKDYGIQRHKNALVGGIKAVAERHLSIANIRVVWKAGRFSQQMPHIDGQLYNQVQLDSQPSDQKASLRGENNLMPTKHRGISRTERITLIYVGAYLKGNSEMHKYTQKLVGAVRSARGRKKNRKGELSPAELEDLLVTVLSRLNGDTLAHEIIHSLIPREGFHLHNGHNVPFFKRNPTDLKNVFIPQNVYFLMNPGQNSAKLRFAALAGIKILQPGQFPRRGSFRDLGQTAATIHPLNRQALQGRVPLDPSRAEFATSEFPFATQDTPKN